MKLRKYETDILGYKATVREVDDIKFDIKYVIEINEFPGILGGGPSLEEALKNVTETLEMFLEVKNTK